MSFDANRLAAVVAVVVVVQIAATHCCYSMIV